MVIAGFIDELWQSLEFFIIIIILKDIMAIVGTIDRVGWVVDHALALQTSLADSRDPWLDGSALATAVPELFALHQPYFPSATTPDPITTAAESDITTTESRSTPGRTRKRKRRRVNPEERERHRDTLADMAHARLQPQLALALENLRPHLPHLTSAASRAARSDASLLSEPVDMVEMLMTTTMMPAATTAAKPTASPSSIDLCFNGGICASGSDDHSRRASSHLLPLSDLLGRVVHNTGPALTVSCPAEEGVRREERFLIPARSSFCVSDLAHIHRLLEPLSPHRTKYHLVVLDPPWENRSALRGSHYSMLQERDFLRLPVAMVCEPHALVAVWVTNRPAHIRFVQVPLISWRKSTCAYVCVKVRPRRVGRGVKSC